MRPPALTSLVLAGLLAGVSLTSAGCVQPHCASPLYSQAECRVIAENELARLRSSSGLELRFQDPSAVDDSSWDARGVLEELADGTVRARVAGPGRFALSVRAPEELGVALRLRLDNVDPAARVTRGTTLDNQQPLPLELSPGSRRSLELSIPPGQTQWIRGDRPCPARYRVAVTSDIQTNPTQFERIVDRLQQEADEAGDEEPLVALVLAGDLTEGSRDDEFETIGEILERLPVPVAVTPGNHDIYRPTRPHYNRRFGPGNHAFDVCGLHGVLLDSGSGSIARSVHARLPELLHRGEQPFLLVGMHHPPHPGQTGAGWSREDEAALLLAELARERADLIIAGHSHALRDFSGLSVADASLREIVVGTGGAYQGAGVPRYGYLRLVFDDAAGSVSSCFVEVPPPGYGEPPNEAPSDRLPYCTQR